MRADTCTCGGLLSETTVPDHGYDVTHLTCYRCHALRVSQDAFDKKAEGDKSLVPSAEKWIARRIPLPND